MSRSRQEQILEQRYRRLLACYPRGYRAAYGEEMLAVAMAAARPGRHWPDPGEAAGLIRSGIRRRLGSLKPGPLDPAWRDAAAAVAIIGPVLMAAFAARPLPVPAAAAYGWQWFEATSFGGIVVAVLWTAVAAAGMLYWRRLAVAGSCVLLAGLILDAGHQTAAGGPYEIGASWWKLLFATLITGSALLAALPALARAENVLLGADPLPSYPGLAVRCAASRSGAHLADRHSGPESCRAPTDDHPPHACRHVPGTRCLWIGIFGTEYPLLFYPTGLPTGLTTWQWPAAIVTASVLCLVIGLTCLSWYERKLRRRGAPA